MRKWSTSILSSCLMLSLAAQSTVIQWSNPSFEDIPGPSRPPLGWYFCGPPEETPPDVHPVALMNVTQKAVHGKTYAGLVVRDNQTQETLGQHLAQALQAGSCYFFRFDAAMSENFSSVSRLTLQPANFAEPVKLQIWGGNEHCERRFLLAETDPVTGNTWQNYQVSFTPPENCGQLFLTAAFAGSVPAYNGHLLIDNLSPIIPVDCETQQPSSTLTAVAEPASGEFQLEEAITRELPGIQWVRDGFSLRQDFFPDPAGKDEWISGNEAIYRISQYLQARPDALLTVVVGPRKDPLVQHHIRLLAAEFMAAGLPPKRCLIRPMKKRDMKKKDWLKYPDNATGVLWGLSYR